MRGKEGVGKKGGCCDINVPLLRYHFSSIST